MSKKRRDFTRRAMVKKPYKRIFHIVAEGSVTEPTYFNHIQRFSESCVVKLAKKRTKSDPLNLLKLAKSIVKKERPEKIDRVWIVCDRDCWKIEHLKDLEHWSNQDDRYGLALSNPSFELWLLYHFEASPSVSNPSQLKRDLKKHLPNGIRKMPSNTITKGHLDRAINESQRRFSQYHGDSWMDQRGLTTVFRLVEAII